MQTSRNPKVLNNALKYKLQPMLDKIENLETLSDDYNVLITDKKEQESSLKNQANEQIELYNSYKTEPVSKINEAEYNLTNLINANLYNPNKSSNGYEDDEGEIVEDTNFITDKIVKCAAYGFVKNGVDYCMFGVTGKGLALGTYPGQDLEYVWRNPENDDEPFASHYINDILLVDTNTAMISTNNGVVIYKFDTNNYILYDTSHGLPSKKINCIIKICNDDETISGFIAATDNGIAYSPTGERWTRIDNSFSAQITCLSTLNYMYTSHKIVFIGTANGIYYLDASKLLNDDVRIVNYLSGSSSVLPNTYVYGLAHNLSANSLAVATIGGTVIINNISNFIENDQRLKPDDVILLTDKNGLIGTSCYDASYTVDNRLILATSNGLSVTHDYMEFKSITKTSNNLDPSGKLLRSHICNKIIRIDAHKYTIIHGVGITENVEI